MSLPNKKLYIPSVISESERGNLTTYYTCERGWKIKMTDGKIYPDGNIFFIELEDAQNYTKMLERDKKIDSFLKY